MKTIIAILSIFLLTACDLYRVSSDYQPYTNFEQYYSFNFSPYFSPQDLNPFDQDRFKNAIKNNLVQKGFAASDIPKMLVNMNVSTETKERIVTFHSPAYYNYGPNFYYAGCPPYGYARGNLYNYPYGGAFANYAVRNRQEVIQYEEWIFTLNFYDAQNSDLIWQGKMVIENLDLDIDPKKKQQRIDKYVEKLLKSYPPQS